MSRVVFHYLGSDNNVRSLIIGNIKKLYKSMYFREKVLNSTRRRTKIKRKQLTRAKSASGELNRKLGTRSTNHMILKILTDLDRQEKFISSEENRIS